MTTYADIEAKRLAVGLGRVELCGLAKFKLKRFEQGLARNGVMPEEHAVVFAMVLGLEAQRKVA